MTLFSNEYPMGFETFRRERLMQLWDDTGAPMNEIKEAYSIPAMRLEWEAMLNRCAEKCMPFSRQLLQVIPAEFQHGINRISKGASIPANYVITVDEQHKEESRSRAAMEMEDCF